MSNLFGDILILSCLWQEINVFPKYLFIVTLIRSFFPKAIFFHKISNQKFIENGYIRNDHKGEIHVYAYDNLFSQINKLVSTRHKVRKTKCNMQKSSGLIPRGRLVKTSLSISCPWSDDLPNFSWIVFCNIMYICILIYSISCIIICFQ